MLEDMREIIQGVEPDLYTLLSQYKNIYTPDIGLTRTDGEQFFDFNVTGGDIQMYGFYYRATFDTLIARAMQDVLLRLFISSENSIFLDQFGLGLLGGKIQDLNEDIIESLVTIALTQSPLIGEVRFVKSSKISADGIRVEFSAKTITNNELSFNEVINYG